MLSLCIRTDFKSTVIIFDFDHKQFTPNGEITTKTRSAVWTFLTVLQYELRFTDHVIHCCERISLSNKNILHNSWNFHCYQQLNYTYFLSISAETKSLKRTRNMKNNCINLMIRKQYYHIRHYCDVILKRSRDSLSRVVVPATAKQLNFYHQDNLALY